jgi:hypothetical protein
MVDEDLFRFNIDEMRRNGMVNRFPALLTAIPLLNSPPF